MPHLTATKLLFRAAALALLGWVVAGAQARDRDLDRLTVTPMSEAGLSASATQEISLSLDTLPPVTVALQIVGDAPFEACADDLDIDGPFLPAQVIATDGPYTAAAMTRGGCVDVDPVAPAAASGRVEVLICREAEATTCQGVVFEITQRASCSDGPFALDTETLAASDDPVEYCLADGADLANYEIRVNGVVAVTGEADGCGGGGGGELTEVYAYSVLNLEDVDYRIDAWDVNGNSIVRLDTRGGLQGLADTMSAFDPDRDWFYNAELGLIHTTEVAGNYSPIIQLFDYRFGSGPTVRLSTEEVPIDDGEAPAGPGSTVTLPGPGNYVVEAYNPTLDCGDRITVIIPPATLPRRDTIAVVAVDGSRSGPYCAPVNELPAPVASFTFCAEPVNGTARLEDPAGCFSYRSSGFIGVDEVCVVACTESPTVCDTTIYLIDVRADAPACAEIFPGDTFDATVADCAGMERVCLPTLPGEVGDYTLLLDGALRPDAVSCSPAGDRVSVPLGPGTYELIARERSTSCADTIAVIVTCDQTSRCLPTLPAALSRGIDCSVPEVEVCLPIPLDSLSRYTLSVDGAAYSGPVENCVAGTELAIDAGELLIDEADPIGPAWTIDSFRIDGELFSGDLPSTRALVDTLNSWDETGVWRYDAATLQIRGGNPNTRYSPLYATPTDLAGIGQVTVILEPVDREDGTLIRIPAGAGARALVLDDGRGCRREVALTLVCVQSSEAFDTIGVRSTVLFCVDESELTGRVERLVNACPGDGLDAVEFDFDAPLGCVTATGLAAGSATACLVACDVNGVCDTTFYTVTVVPEEDGVEAVDDVVLLRADTTVRVSVTDNDRFGVLSSIRITEQPLRGAANLSPEGILTYTPAAGACNFVDTLRYEICEGAICSSATVELRVRCGPLEVYDAFTPNGDGINETFVIEGIELLPEASVRVYNRWGNLVFEAEDNYQNDWSATWDGNRLPQGTYFYLVEIPGEEPVAGYVQVWR